MNYLSCLLVWAGLVLPCHALNWSDRTVWGGELPKETTDVVIPSGQKYVLDVPNVVVRSITVWGTLELARMDVSLTAGTIMVMGSFIAGTPQEPFVNRLTITLNGQERETATYRPHPHMGGRFFASMGNGVIQLIAPSSTSWVMLGKTARKGASSILLDTQVSWQPGDVILITSTDFDVYQAEKASISSISANGRTLILNENLRHLHYGERQSFGHHLSGAPREIDERAEVGRLSCHIVVQGAADADQDGPMNGYGGHMMFMDDAEARFQGVEFRRMGQKGLLGRYPVHWHGVDNAKATLINPQNPAAGYIRGSSTSYVRNCSIHHSFNRGITIHRTNYITVSSNVLYDVIGHGYFLEDGREIGNVFMHNLGALVKVGPLIPSDAHPAVFWTPNPNNDYYLNAAAGAVSEGYGFKFEPPLAIPSNTISYNANDPYSPAAQPYGRFWGNRAHSIIGNSSSDPTNNGFGLWALNGLVGPDTFKNFTGFKLAGGGVWFVPNHFYSGHGNFQNFKLVGNQVLRNYPGVLLDSLAVGRSNNPISQSDEVSDRSEKWWLERYDRENANIALGGYDSNASALRSVFIGYRHGIYPVRSGWTGETARGCELIDSIFVRASGLPLVATEYLGYYAPDFEDVFQNGSNGIFFTQEFFRDESSRGVESGVGGIAPDDNVTHWTPYSLERLAGVDFHTSVPCFGFIRRDDSNKEFRMYPGSYASPDIGHIAVLTDHINAVRFEGLPGNDSSSITIFYINFKDRNTGDVSYTNNGHYVGFGFTAPGKPFNLGAVYAPLQTQVFNSQEFKEAANNVWFLDPRTNTFYVKAFVTTGFRWVDRPENVDVSGARVRIDQFFAGALVEFGSAPTYEDSLLNSFRTDLSRIWNPAEFSLANRQLLQAHYDTRAREFCEPLLSNFYQQLHALDLTARRSRFQRIRMINAVFHEAALSTSDDVMRGLFQFRSEVTAYQ